MGVDEVNLLPVLIAMGVERYYSSYGVKNLWN